MAVPEHVGSIIYTEVYEAEVWFYPDDHHIFILVGTSQVGDFAVNQPCKADPQQIAADHVYRQWLKMGCPLKAFIDPIDDDVVIEVMCGQFLPPPTFHQEALMDKVEPDTLFLPEPGLRHLPCGVHVREWNYCVVYVRSPNSDHSVSQKFYFSFYATGDYYLDEVVTLVAQWTHWRGDSFAHFASDSHEFRRARKMACKIVGTYRRAYLAKHGSEPNPLLLNRTLDDSLTPALARRLFSKPDHSGSAQLTLQIASQPR